MVIDAVERFAEKTARHCIDDWSVEEIKKRSPMWPPGYEQKVTEHIKKLAA